MAKTETAATDKNGATEQNKTDSRDDHISRIRRNLSIHIARFSASESPRAYINIPKNPHLFRQNTYLQNKKHTLTCQGGTGCYRFNYQPGS